MGMWDQTQHEVWGYLLHGRWNPCADKRSAVTLVDGNPDRKLAKRTLGPVEEVKDG
jgi:hypothetical protein